MVIVRRVRRRRGGSGFSDFTAGKSKIEGEEGGEALFEVLWEDSRGQERGVSH